MSPKIIKLPSQGFCFGVIRALKFATTALTSDFPKPIYLIGSLVHNRFVNEYLRTSGIIVKEGINKSELIDEITEGTVIFTAHGIDQKIKDKASQKGLTVIDATCPFVTKSFDLIKAKLSEGYEILYLGKKNHPETMAALSLSPHVHLIESERELDQFPTDLEKVALTNQTTMSIFDIAKIEEWAKKKYPNLVMIDKVCQATKVRQEVLGDVARKAKDEKAVAFIIVGDPTSNNTKKLAETAREISGHDVYQVEQLDDLPFEKLKQYQTIFLTSGTSTPNAIVDEIYEYLLTGLDSPSKSKLKLFDYTK